MRLRYFFTLAYLASAVTGWSQQLTEDELERRERTAANKVSEANSLDRSYGYYQKVRDEHFYGPTGIQTLSEKFFEDSQRWINGWSSLLAAIDLGNETLDQVYTKVQIKMDGQAYLLLQLNLESLEISKKSETALRVLARGSTIRDGQLDEYADIVKIAIANSKALEEALKSVSRKAESKIADMERANDLAYQAVLGKMKAELIRVGQYPLEESLSRFRDLKMVEEASSSYRSEIYAKTFLLHGYTLDFAYYQAKQTWKDIRVVCHVAKDSLANLDSPYAEVVRLSIIAQCGSADNLWNSMNTMGLTPAEMVQEYAFLMAPALQQNCKSRTPKLDCERFAVLKAVSANALSAMAEDRLEFYERQWAELASRLEE
ncbi:MAG: hypothetical protein HRU19_05960 [Pseudobacteriovorax sp.]|nr:hypothetical protein [Pseudobacteriovorax sp.]